jgi:8-oxo-dGTP pyrophosphatase MutT (NUDIX family)
MQGRVTGARIESAVLAPVFRDAAGVLRLVLLRRADGGLHGGQLGFPGGKCEPTDGSPLETALREAEEEIGLPRGRVTVLAPLPVLETRTTGFTIHPFVARIERPAAWRPAEREVAEVLEPAVGELADAAAHGEEVRTFATWEGPRTVPFIHVGPHRLWGATHRIVVPLLPRLLAGEWAL